MKRFLVSILSLMLLCGCACVDKCADDSSQKKRKIAIHGYVYEKLSLVDTVKIAVDLGVDGVVLTKRQFIGGKYPNVKVNENMTPEQRDYVKKLFKDANLEIASIGVYRIPVKDIEKNLAFCKDMGIKIFTEEHPNEDEQKYYNELSEKYGVVVALHNHGRKFNKYWEPAYVKKLIDEKYPNIKTCSDNGHWARAGVDCVEGYKTLAGKIAMLHFKDVDEKGRDTCLGGGTLNIKKMLKGLDENGFDGYFVLEYEGDKSLLDINTRKSIKYLREN